MAFRRVSSDMTSLDVFEVRGKEGSSNVGSGGRFFEDMMVQ